MAECNGGLRSHDEFIRDMTAQSRDYCSGILLEEVPDFLHFMTWKMNFPGFFPEGTLILADTSEMKF